MTTNLLLVRRLLTGTLVAALVAFVVVTFSHPSNPGPSLSYGAGTSAPLTFPWTPQLAREFPGCQAHVSGIPAAFVVERMSGHMQRMGFDATWRRTHDAQHADDVWVRGVCA